MFQEKKRKGDDLALLLATGFGSGRLPKAPGTWGSALALLIGIAAIEYGGFKLLNLMLALALVVGLWASHRYQALSGRHDASEIVIDEVVGQWIAMLPLAASAVFANAWLGYGLAFVLFRLFDIWKPWPISLIDQRVPGALGVMLDDILAGLAAALVLILLSRVF